MIRKPTYDFAKREIGHRERIFFLVRLFYEETDEENPIPMREILDCFQIKFGSKPKRQTIIDDIKAISKNLFKISGGGKSGYYRLIEEVDHADGE